MRRRLAAGNWKMNGSRAALAEVAALVAAHPAPTCDVLLCPPATHIVWMSEVISGSPIDVGGQDCHPNASGAHTGDIAAAMLKDAGASHVILGHSERRADHGETDDLVRAKAKAAIAAGLTPLICLGETLAQRDAGETLAVVSRQLAGSVPDSASARTIIAYEPVWAIGTGLTPTSNDVAAVHKMIRNYLISKDKAEGYRIRVLYGGSVKPGNAKELMGIPNVNGALVGGASLKATDFLGIAAAYA